MLRRSRIRLARWASQDRLEATGYHWSIDDHFLWDEDRAASARRQVLPAETNRLPEPDWFGAPFGPLLHSRESTLEPVEIFTFPGARIIGGNPGALVTRSRRLIRPFAPDPFDVMLHPLLHGRRGPATHRFRRVLALQTPEVADNYGHWAYDQVPRLQMIVKAGLGWKDFDAITVASEGRRFQEETYEEFGIPRDRLVVLKPGMVIETETCTVPSLVRMTQVPHRTLLSWQSERPEREPARKPGRRLIISRGTARFRRMLDEDELVAALSRLGFTLLDPLPYSLAELRWIFRRAEAVVGPHGSGMLDAVDLPEGGLVAEIHNGIWEDCSTYNGVKMTGKRYGVTSGTPVTTLARARFRDFRLGAGRRGALVDWIASQLP